MSYNWINQDITEVTEGLIMHGVNCQRVMGSGVAKAIKEKWPGVYEQYMEETPRLGGYHLIDVNDKIRVMNCYTQDDYGRNAKKYASLLAVVTCFCSALEEAEFFGGILHLPKVGCGLGGLDWEEDVGPIVKKLAHNSDVNVWVHEI